MAGGALSRHRASCRTTYHDVVAHIARWPESAPHAAGREGVRVVPLGRYPYKVFYRLTADTVEILHIHHTAWRPSDEPA